MASVTAPLREDLDADQPDTLGVRGIRPLRGVWYDALARRAQQYVRIPSGPAFVSGLLYMGISSLGEESPTTFSTSALEGAMGTWPNASCALTIFPQSWPFADFVEIPTGAGKRNEPVVKGKGVPVWVLVSYVVKRRLTPWQISRLWNGYISPQEVLASLAYWQANPEAIEDKLAD